MEYKVKIGETISDVVLNSTGGISSWFDFIDKNNFDDWCPNLLGDQVLQVPYIINNTILTELIKHPVNNRLLNLSSQINDLINLLDSIVNIPVNNFPDIIQNYENYYKIKEVNTIGDVCLNGTGTIINWEQILNDNLFEDWVPKLFKDQQILISKNCKLQNNVLNEIVKNPVINRMPKDINEQINKIIAIFTGHNKYLFSDGTPYLFNNGNGTDDYYLFEN